MTCRHPIRICALYGLVAALAATSTPLRADDAAELKREFETLRKQNAALQEQLRRQQSVIDELTKRVAGIEQTAGTHDVASTEPREDSKAGDVIAKTPAGFNIGKVNISGEGGVGLFHTQREGAFPNAEFRVDVAKLFVEAPVWNDIYAVAELSLMTRENEGLGLSLGELYVDFENVSRWFGRDRLLNVRVGRFDIPFGEEYLQRDAIDNPLISHSLSDIWGVDEGVELYGSLGKVSYVIAVQNGGVSGGRDYDSDKAVVGRLSYDPTPWLHLSASGMRTGNLNAWDDFISELWFGNGWVRSIGSPATTLFHANLVEGDIAVKLPRGHLRAFGGYLHYGDNDPAANNRRDVYYYSVEGVHEITRRFYAAARFSQIFAHNGFPIVGHGEFNNYFNNELTTDIWRLSLGVGYRLGEHALIKTEYTFERGHELSGDWREREDFFGAEVAFKF